MVMGSTYYSQNLSGWFSLRLTTMRPWSLCSRISEGMRKIFGKKSCFYRMRQQSGSSSSALLSMEMLQCSASVPAPKKEEKKGKVCFWEKRHVWGNCGQKCAMEWGRKSREKRWECLIRMLFQQKFYLDCRYWQGLANTIPKSQLYGTGSFFSSPPHEQEPSNQEVDQMLSLLQKQFSHKKAVAIVNKLYEQVVQLALGRGRLKELGQSCEIIANYKESPYALRPIPSNLLQQIQSVEHNINIAYNITAEAPPYRTFQTVSALAKVELSLQERRRQERRQAIALSFLKHGYGHHSYLESLRTLGKRDIISPNKYHIMARSVVAEIYLSFEKFLQEHHHVINLTKELLSIGVEYLIKCKDNMKQEDCLILMKAVKNAFSCESTTFHTLNQMDVAVVYHAVQCHIKKVLQRRAIKLHYRQRATFEQQKGEEEGASSPYMPKMRSAVKPKPRKERRFIQRGCLEKVWDEHLQRTFIRLFLEDCEYSSLRDRFSQVYPEHAELISITELKRQLHKLIRIAIRKLKGAIQSFGEEAPQLVSMTDRRTKYLMVAESNQIANRQIMRFYSEKSSEAQLYRTVQVINGYIAKKDAEYEQRLQYQTEQDWEDCKIDNDETIHHSSSQNDHAEEFKPAKRVPSNMGFTALAIQSTDKGDLITSDTYPQRMDQLQKHEKYSQSSRSQKCQNEP